MLDLNLCEMKKKSNGLLIMLPIVSAIIWGAVIIGCSLKLSGTPYYAEISNILYGGVISHIIIIGAALGIQSKKMKNSE